jgi:abortive infection bacteriophage resistance protein
MPGTSLQGILDLYLYDKRLRLAVLDAIERIEVHIRTVIAHELGRLDPVAHTMASFINQRFLQDYQDRKSRKKRNTWNEWLEDHGKHLSRCSEDCILWHKQNDKTMPFWVVVEAWSFGSPVCIERTWASTLLLSSKSCSQRPSSMKRLV